MKKYFLLFSVALLSLLASTSFAQLQIPVPAYATAAFTSQDGIINNFPSIGVSPTIQQPESIIFSPSNISDVIHAGATPNLTCYTTDLSDPASGPAGTCGHGTPFIYGVSSPINITGRVTLRFISTAAGSTDSGIGTSTITVQPFFPAPGPYSYPSFKVTLTGDIGSPLIYTTDQSEPSADGSCTPINGTVAANGVQVAVPPLTTEVIKFASCSGGVLGPVQTGTYITRAQETWYVEPYGDTRYSANMPNGHCNGLADASYASTGGTGVNKNCAFAEFRYLWDDYSGVVGAGQFVMAGGDKAILGGCHGTPYQLNDADPHCRIGWDNGGGGGTTNPWSTNQGNDIAFNPTIPPGSPTQPTQFLGQNFASCATGGLTNPRDYASNLTQLFGGFGLRYTFDLRNTQNVAIECIELTTHNGVCTSAGSPSSPRGCSTNSPVDDYAQNGWLLNRNSSGITFQDVYTHGFNASGMYGPFGANITMTRVFDGFNAFAGWNMDDGLTTPNGPSSSIFASYVTMVGNGCNEEYPVVHDFSAQTCYDDVANGFGDAWSGQDTKLDTFVCDHCDMHYNTKDAFIGPHPLIKTLTITNSTSYDSMGSQWKHINDTDSTMTFVNNETVGNCARLQQILPGASKSFAAIQISSISVSSGVGTFTTSAHSFTAGQVVYVWGFNHAGQFLDGQWLTVLSSGLTSTQFQANVSAGDGVYTDYGYTNTQASGAFLSDFCRAGGNSFSSNLRAGDNWLIANSTFVNPVEGYHIFLDCGIAYNHPDFSCGTATLTFDNDIFLGFALSGRNPPSLLYPLGDSSIVAHFNNTIDFGNKAGSGVPCGTNGNICADPKLVGQPAQVAGGWPNITFLDGFNFKPSGSSPAIGAGTAYTGSPAKDYAGVNSTSPLVIGALNFGVSTLNTVTVNPSSATISVGGTQTFAASCSYSDGSTTPCAGTWTDTGTHSTVGSSTGVVTGVSVGTDTNTITYTVNGIFGTATVIVNAAPSFIWTQGAVMLGRTN